MTDCACIYVGDNYEPGEFSDSRFIKARLDHKCGECGRPITKGNNYERTGGKWDGEMRTYITCADCVSIRNQFFCHGWGYERVIDDLWDHICAMQGNISGDCISPLTPGARKRVCDLIEVYWSESDD